MKNARKLALIALLLVAAWDAHAIDKTYLIDSLVIPMDTTHQDDGMLLAYGLVDSLLRAGVPVDWVIEPDKAYGGADFSASVEDVQSSSPITHGYRGGPFVVDSAYYTTALALVQAWQADHPEVAVHRVTLPFVANAARELLNAPTIAVFADGKEDVAFGYLNAAGIPMSNGDPWPARKDKNGLYPCPGDKCCPDCFNEEATAGPTTTSHVDGALFDSDGIPRYCQFMSMHYKAPAPVPEVVAEVREFLEYPVHFFAECQAVNAFENDVNGHFLSSNGLAIANEPGAVDHHDSDSPFAQADGAYENPGGSEPAYKLDVASFYYSPGVVMLTEQGLAEGEGDVWMTGHVDGDETKGKVSYLGAHKYDTTTPISANPTTQGTRYFLNSLFEAPCTSNEGTADVTAWADGPDATNSSSYELSLCYENLGPGIAFDAELVLDLPAGATFVSASGGGTPVGDTVVWSLGSLPVDTDACQTVTVSFAAEGTFEFSSTLTYGEGMSGRDVGSGPFAVRFGHVNLLRYGGVIATTPALSPAKPLIFATQAPITPALVPARDIEVVAFGSADPFPSDGSDLAPNSPPLVYYELEGASGDTLRITKSAGTLVVTY